MIGRGATTDGHGLLASVAVVAVSLSKTPHVEQVTCRLLLAGDGSGLSARIA